MGESEQYKEVCKGEFEKINHKLDRLYVDNGGESFQSKINRHELFILRITKLIYIVLVPLTALFLNTIRTFIVDIMERAK